MPIPSQPYRTSRLDGPSRRGPRVNGSVPDASYDRIGLGYACFRKPDPRVTARLMPALEDARLGTPRHRDLLKLNTIDAGLRLVVRKSR